MLLLTVPQQIVTALSQHLNHTALANDCRTETVHVVVFAVQPFGTHPKPLAIGILILPRDDGNIDIGNGVGIVRGTASFRIRFAGGGNGGDFGDAGVSHQVFGGGEEMHGVVEDPRIVAATGFFAIHAPVSGFGDFFNHLSFPFEPSAVPLAYLEGASNLSAVNQFACLHVGSDKDIRFTDNEFNAAAFYGFAGFEAFSHVPTEWFLAVDVHPGFGGLAGH